MTESIWPILGNAVEQADVVCFMFDARGEPLFQNDRARAMTGQAGNGRLPLSRLRHLIHPSGRSRLRRALAGRRGHRALSLDAVLPVRVAVPGDSVRFWCHVQWLPAREGRPAAWLVLANEVNEVDILDAQESSGEQSLDPARRNAALMQADRQKNEFLSLLSHELRGPLSPLRNAVALLLDDQPGERPRAHLLLIERQVRRMARLLDDLLDVSRILNDRLHLSLETIDLAQLVQQVCADFRMAVLQANGRPSEVLLSLPTEPVTVLADPSRLAQVLNNLLDNAVKFTAGGKPIRVEVDQDGDSVRMSVIDQGIGLSAGDTERIFRRHEQVAGSLGHNGQGMGLGLFLARQLVMAHGGQVQASSGGPGQGSQFIVNLPRTASDSPSLPSETHSLACDRPLRLLVVEDHADSAHSLMSLLRHWGHEVSWARDGLQGLDQAIVIQPDAVLLDIDLPGLDGFELARRIRAQPWGARVRLLATTGFGRREDLMLGQDVGVDAYLVKPLDPLRLRSVLSEWAGARLSPAGDRRRIAGKRTSPAAVSARPG